MKPNHLPVKLANAVDGLEVEHSTPAVPSREIDGPRDHVTAEAATKAHLARAVIALTETLARWLPKAETA